MPGKWTETNYFLCVSPSEISKLICKWRNSSSSVGEWQTVCLGWLADKLLAAWSLSNEFSFPNQTQGWIPKTHSYYAAEIWNIHLRRSYFPSLWKWQVWWEKFFHSTKLLVLHTSTTISFWWIFPLQECLGNILIMMDKIGVFFENVSTKKQSFHPIKWVRNRGLPVLQPLCLGKSFKEIYKSKFIQFWTSDFCVQRQACFS